MKQKLEEAAKEYAESVIDSFGTNGIPNGVSDIKEMIALSFEMAHHGFQVRLNLSSWMIR